MNFGIIGLYIYYLITRYYDSKTGRFINEDDHAFLGSSGNTLGYNLYAYCENDPVNCVDPTGRALATATVVTAGVALAGLFLAAFSLTTGFKMAWENAMLTVITGLQDGLRNIRGLTDTFISWASRKAKVVWKSVSMSMEKVVTIPNYRKTSELHHMVAKRAHNAKRAADILEDVGLGVNHFENLILLKTGLHRRIHTDVYYGWANSMVISAFEAAQGNLSKQESNVKTALRSLRAFLNEMNRNAKF